MSDKQNLNKKIDYHNQEQEEFQSDTRPRWYIVQTYVGFEDAVRKNLELKIENLNLNEKILEIFIPTKKALKLNSKGERIEKIEKIYPGYIYIYMILDREVGYTIQNTSHVSRIAGTGNLSVPLEDGYVENLKEKLLKESDVKSISKSVVYNLGDRVEVMEGPFKDMRGEVCGLDVPNSQISVLLSIFGRDTSVDFDLLEIRKLDITE